MLFLIPSICLGAEFSVGKGQNILQVSKNLQTAGLLENRFLFIWEAFFSGQWRKIKVGQYEIRNDSSPKEILAILVAGRVAPKKVTIISGWTIKDIAKALSRQGICSSGEFLEYTLATSSVEALIADFEFLRELPQGAGLEGYLYPDTYNFEAKSRPEKVVRQMLENFQKKIILAKNFSLPKSRNAFSILTMASLLEKEVRSFEDKKIVAGILWKRLDAGYPLEVDSSLEYFRVGKGSLSKNPQLKTEDSGYNTYKYSGLPLGPICNPAKESFEAAFSPAPSPYWFYLSAPDGKTIFSKNLREHLINKEKYLVN
ncbi:MAG: endolytic transglycosylase MltG [Candidatus Paceibacterota bacterium]